MNKVVSAHPTASTSRQALTRIQRLSCLGLGGQIVMPALMHELHGLVPACSNHFKWAGPELEIANSYTDGPVIPELLEVFHSEQYRKAERLVLQSFTEVMQEPQLNAVEHVSRSFLKVDWPNFLKSDAYNLFYRPLDICSSLTIKLGEHDRGLGMMFVCRDAGAAEFTLRDYRLLELAVPFMTHALAGSGITTPLAESEDRAMVITDAQGRILHWSAEARRLLLMIRHEEWSPKLDWHSACGRTLPEPAVRLCRQLVGVCEGKMQVAPPVWHHRNAWGSFELRAYPLQAERQFQEPMQSRLDENTLHDSSSIGITVQRKEPLSLQLLRKAESLPLSRREVDFCIHAATGCTHAQIAERMGITEHSAITHGRNVYGKLGVHSRVALFNALRAF
jgi:DNA-binding CsgD family transcriptional regulator